MSNYDKVALLLPMSGANNGTVFPDWGPTNVAVTPLGSIVTVTAQSKFYGSSARFDGTNDQITLPNTLLHMGSAPFIIDGWVRADNFSAARGIIGQRSSGAGDYNFLLFLNSSSQLGFGIGTTAGTAAAHTLTSTGTLTANTWHHFEASRTGDTVRLFLDGVLEATQALSASFAFHASADTARIGAYNTAASNFLLGYLQDLRVVKGVGGNTATFTPPARRIGVISNSAGDPVRDIAGVAAERTIVAVPRIAPVRLWSTVSNSSGVFSIEAPAGVDHSVISLADETALYNDLVHRVIPV